MLGAGLVGRPVRPRGRVAAVTGGGSGLGAAMAAGLAQAGAAVAVVDVDEDGGRARSRAAIAGGGGAASAVRCDVTDSRRGRARPSRAVARGRTAASTCSSTAPAPPSAARPRTSRRTLRRGARRQPEGHVPDRARRSAAHARRGEGAASSTSPRSAASSPTRTRGLPRDEGRRRPADSRAGARVDRRGVRVNAIAPTLFRDAADASRRAGVDGDERLHPAPACSREGRRRPAARDRRRGGRSSPAMPRALVTGHTAAGRRRLPDRLTVTDETVIARLQEVGLSLYEARIYVGAAAQRHAERQRAGAQQRRAVVEDLLRRSRSWPARASSTPPPAARPTRSRPWRRPS